MSARRTNVQNNAPKSLESSTEPLKTGSKVLGRPCLYKEEYCDQVIEWGKKGKSFAWIATELKVTRETLHAWASIHENFSDAMTIAKAAAQAWHEDMGDKYLVETPNGDRINTGYLKFVMGARFDDYRPPKENKMELPAISVTWANEKPNNND